MAGGHTFKWVKPEVYPLIVPVCFALAAMSYSLVRHVYTNPEVFPTKKARTEQYTEAELRDRAGGYSSSFFRNLQEGRGLRGIFGDAPKE